MGRIYDPAFVPHLEFTELTDNLIRTRGNKFKLVQHHCHYDILQSFNGLFSRTTWVSRYQKGKTNLDFTGARDSEWQWHQLGHMQVCTSLQRDNHASTPPLCGVLAWLSSVIIKKLMTKR